MLHSDPTPHLGPNEITLRSPSLPKMYSEEHGVERPGVITAHNDRLKISANPEKGGQLEEVAVQLGDQWVRITPRDTPAFLMVPYSNRIRDGHFSFEGKSYSLERAEVHALHGDGRGAPWQVIETSDTKIVLSFTSEPSVKANGLYSNFPFPYAAVVTYELQDNAVIHSLEIRNTGESNLPTGGGIHPYFLRSLVEGEKVELQFTSGGEYPAETDVPLPIAPLAASSGHSDFSSLKPVEPFLDTCFGGWNGVAAIYWPEAQLHARIQGSPELKHVVVYAPNLEAEESYFCFEPVVNMTDGINYLDDPRFDTGIVVLKPGESLKSTFTITFDLPIGRDEASS